MSNQKKHAAYDSDEDLDEPNPQSRVRIKPQGEGAGVTGDSVEQLIAEAEAGNWSREEIVDRLLDIKLAGATALTDEERAEFRAQARKLFLEDPRFR